MPRFIFRILSHLRGAGVDLNLLLDPVHYFRKPKKGSKAQ